MNNMDYFYESINFKESKYMNLKNLGLHKDIINEILAYKFNIVTFFSIISNVFPESSPIIT